MAIGGGLVLFPINAAFLFSKQTVHRTIRRPYLVVFGSIIIGSGIAIFEFRFSLAAIGGVPDGVHLSVSRFCQKHNDCNVVACTRLNMPYKN